MNGSDKVYPDAGEMMVIQPAPTPTNWGVGTAALPDVEKGVTVKFVTLDLYTTLGVNRNFLEADAARTVAAQLLEAADLVDGGRGHLDIVQGGRAHQITEQLSRAQRRHPEHDGRVTRG